MDQHLTVTEARKLTGKSDSTIKRMIREVTADPKHSERSFILPSHEEVERRKAAGEPYVWKIDRELLRRRFDAPEPEAADDAPTASTSGGGEHDVVLQVLREQLKSKDEQLRTLETQLDRKDEQISNLNERMRESNVLMKELQQRLAIAAPAKSSPAEVIDAKEQGSGTGTSKESTPAKQAQPKKGLSRWFTLR
ncbi:MAG: hypothetical protein KDA68_16535 [Planctomycetaceae bacterium]|nr:hypothetical protein [Planctomycetaceae bacterium]